MQTHVPFRKNDTTKHPSQEDTVLMNLLNQEVTLLSHRPVVLSCELPLRFLWRSGSVDSLNFSDAEVDDKRTIEKYLFRLKRKDSRRNTIEQNRTEGIKVSKSPLTESST